MAFAGGFELPRTVQGGLLFYFQSFGWFEPTALRSAIVLRGFCLELVCRLKQDADTSVRRGVRFRRIVFEGQESDDGFSSRWTK